MYFSSIYISTSLIAYMIAMVSTQLNLCSDNFKIDSISYLPDKDQWFFTSNGHYWLIKGEQLKNFTDQDISGGKPLPNGFKRGDAAVYKNSLKACKALKTGGVVTKQEIVLMEMIGEWNTIMIYDLIDNKWGEPHRYDTDICMNQPEVGLTEPIDAMFAYDTTQIYFIKKERYAGIDFKIQCEKPNEFCTKFPRNTYYDFNTKDTIDALTLFNNNKFIMFQGRQFFEGTIIKVENGRFTTHKDSSQDIVRDFFHYKGCKHRTPDATTANPDVEPLKPEESAVSSVAPDPQEDGFWIIIVVIVIIVIVVFVVLIVIFAVRKNRADPEDGIHTQSSTSITGQSITTRPTANMQGSSPSRMSVRSNISTTPKISAQPKSPSSSPNKKSIPVKPSPSPKKT